MNIGVVNYQTSLTKGQELLAQRMVRELIKQGHKAFLITGPFHDNEPTVEYGALERSVGGYLLSEWSEFQIPIIRVDGHLSSWPPRRIMFNDFLSILRNIADRFRLDVIISHSTLWNGPEEIAKFVAWKKMLKTQGLAENEIVYAHMSHYQPPDSTLYDIVERTYRTVWNTLVFPQIFNIAKLILCVTPVEEGQMMNMGASKGQCHLYPGGVDEEIFRKYGSGEASDFFERNSIPTDAKLVTYLGTVEERKNPLAVVRVARMLRGVKDIHFVVAGRPSNQDRLVREEAKGLDNLSYIQAVSEGEKVALIKASYANILLSRVEALGLTQLEFMYGGVPVVTSAVGGQEWLVRNGVDGIHVRGPSDLKGAAEAVRALADNFELRDRLGENAENRAAEFTLSKITSQLTYRLKTLLNP